MSHARPVISSPVSEKGAADVVLSVSSLNAGYGDVNVLWDVSLHLHRGEVVALVGSNGAGKTTLLRALSGVLPVTHGHLQWKGRDVTHTTCTDRVVSGIVHVPEGRHVFYGLSVRNNLVLGAIAQNHTKQEIESDLEWIYSLFPELKTREKHVAGLLSGGEQQMLAIGRGLMARPELLLIDEMSLGLAPVVVERMLPSISKVSAERKVAVLLVDQDVDLALEIASRGYVLENGRVALEGDARALRESDQIVERYLRM